MPAHPHSRTPPSALAADAAAAANGVALDAYDRRVYVLPPSACPWTGYGTYGGNPSRAWVFRCDRASTYAHELGHNLDLRHASTPGSEYGDGSDPMGSGSLLRQLNGPHKDQLGWLPPEQVQRVARTGVYRIAALEQAPWSAPAPQILTLEKRDTGEVYYLSYRRPIGFDANLSSVYLNRLSVHRHSSSHAGPTYLLGVLGDGSSFFDAANGLRFTQLGQSDGAVTVEISFEASCAALPPALSLAPLLQEGAPGTAFQFTAALVNQDDKSCPSSTWSLAADVDSAWMLSISPVTLTLSPGQKGAAALQVTSPPSAAHGTSVEVVLRAADALEPVHAALGAATVRVLIDAEPPSPPTGLSANVKRNRVSLTWKAATDNVGVKGYVVWRDALRLGETAATSYVDESVDAGATHAYSVVALDAAGNLSAPSAALVVVVPGSEGGPGRGKPK